MTQKKKPGKIRIALFILTGLLALWFALPIFTGIIGIGSLLPLCVLAAVLLILWKWEGFCDRIRRLWSHVSGKVILTFAGLTVMTGAVTFCVVSGLMISAINTAPSGDTVIVLGAKSINGEPMLMLANRLDAAIAYLEENPQAVCIVTGGQGEDEQEPEAVSMHRYLLRHGIEENRIYMEDQATNTSENLRYSTDLIHREGLSEKVVVVTDEFHQYRAQYFGKECGLTISAKASVTPWYLLPTYWVREIGAVLKALFLGY